MRRVPAAGAAGVAVTAQVFRGRLHFVLPIGIGQTEIVDDVTHAELIKALGSIGIKRPPR